MKRQYTTREYVLGGIFSLLAAFPIVSESGIDVPLQGSVTGEVLARAFEDRSAQSHLRRMRWSIMRDCAQREALGEKDVCPDVNDVDAMNRYWMPEEHAASAPVEDVVRASMSDLGDFEKHLLRRARRTGQCPVGLDDLTPGFQALCEDAMEEGSDRQDAIREAVERWTSAPRIER